MIPCREPELEEMKSTSLILDLTIGIYTSYIGF